MQKLVIIPGIMAEFCSGRVKNSNKKVIMLTWLLLSSLFVTVQVKTAVPNFQAIVLSAGKSG